MSQNTERVARSEKQITTGRKKKVVGRLKQQNPGREIGWQNGAPYFTDTKPPQRIDLR